MGFCLYIWSFEIERIILLVEYEMGWEGGKFELDLKFELGVSFGRYLGRIGEWEEIGKVSLLLKGRWDRGFFGGWV